MGMGRKGVYFIELSVWELQNVLIANMLFLIR